MKRKLKLGRLLTSMAVFLIICSGISVFASELNSREGFAIKAGVDMPGKLDVVISGSDSTKSMDFGFSGELEYAKGINKMFSFGGGISGQFPRSVDDSNFEGKLSFYEGFGLVNFVLPFGLNNVDFYSSLRLGWAMPFANDDFDNNFGSGTDLSGDIFWGASLGIVIMDNYLVELYYKTHHGEVENGSSVEEFEYRHFGFAVGYQF